MIAKIQKSKVLGEVTAPGSKSHTIRAVLLALLSQGESVIYNPLTASDGLSALAAARAFGAEVKVEPGKWTVTGVGKTPKTPENYLDCGNSGTTRSFAASIAALCNGTTYLTGDEQIRTRPVIQILDAINELGGQAEPALPGSISCPAVIKGPMKGGSAHLGGSNSQFISSLLLTANILDAPTEIYVKDPMEKPYIRITLDWMKRYGAEVDEYAADFTHFTVKGGKTYKPSESHIPSDWSAVAFPLVAAVVTDSELTISGVDFNDSQGDKRVVDILIETGAEITKDTERGLIVIKGGKPLKSGITIDMNDIPDALPALCVAACFAEGETRFTSLTHLREKETDRVKTMVNELKKLGADAFEEGPDTMVIRGGKPLTGAEVESYGDHRLAMSLTVAGMFAEGVTTIKRAECAETSFPGFYALMKGVGAKIDLEN